MAGHEYVPLFQRMATLMLAGFSNNWGGQGASAQLRGDLNISRWDFPRHHLPALLLQPLWVGAGISQESSSLKAPLQSV